MSICPVPTTVEDVINAVQGVDIGDPGRHRRSGRSAQLHQRGVSGVPMSISEVSGGTTATDLGRAIADRGSTLLSGLQRWAAAFRSGPGSVDPLTGTPDPVADQDIQITTKDGTVFAVDFAGVTTAAGCARCDQCTAAAAAGLSVGTGPGDNFFAGLPSDGNGLWRSPTRRRERRPRLHATERLLWRVRTLGLLG